MSEQPFVDFGSAAPCLPDLARVLRCNLPRLVLQAAPAHTTSSLQRVPCCFPLSSTLPYLPSLVKHLFGGSAAPGCQPTYITCVDSTYKLEWCLVTQSTAESTEPKHCCSIPAPWLRGQTSNWCLGTLAWRLTACNCMDTSKERFPQRSKIQPLEPCILSDPFSFWLYILILSIDSLYSYDPWGLCHVSLR